MSESGLITRRGLLGGILALAAAPAIARASSLMPIKAREIVLPRALLPSSPADGDLMWVQSEYGPMKSILIRNPITVKLWSKALAEHSTRVACFVDGHTLKHGDLILVKP